ncbi:hypothetical protein AZI85_00130 [Bdellovibrio bacteriovorus]|uniref:Zinc-regulated TonB-dependent outer membrane receptor n=1 Tax=Bdellovibrio bacteriovorus TaxID=959 RepID=A0A150WVA0_BDEBC|nr:hypothetical protein [Bdellovibrio bacteriovorus]KYG70401.1 hypothetical protein AZI85_00130 [Bdellovibrio bacteriovorus]
MKCFTVALFILLSGAQASAQNLLQNIQTAAAIDIVAPFDFEGSEENKLDIRSAELSFFGPLDPTFDAYLNAAAHNEDGEFVFEVHEAFVSSSKLIPSSRFKIGKFFLGVGRLNQFHQHDWAFISAPRVQTEFFDEEGVADTGGEFSTLLPTDSYWDITAGVTNGYTYGHAHDAGEKPRVPTHYIHPVNFIDFGDAGALQWGMNYLGRTDAQGIQTQLYGLDFVFKKMEGKVLRFLLQSEIWYRNLKALEADRQEDIGAYIYPQMSLSERLFLGLRVDLFSELSRTFQSDGSKQDNLDYGFVPTLTYKHSEFTWFRVAYTYDVQTYKGESDDLNQKIELQLVSILGAHPAHSF